MELVVIYGQPGVGKLTVAQELSTQLGYKILHLHQTIDLVTTLFDRTHKKYSYLNRLIRLELIKAAAEEGIAGLLLTYGYGSPTSHEFIHDLVALGKSHSVRLSFVHLSCSLEELCRRVEEPSRQGTGKIQSKEVLLEALEIMHFSIIPHVEHLSIDTTTQSAKDSALQIITTCKLRS